MYVTHIDKFVSFKSYRVDKIYIDHFDSNFVVAYKLVLILSCIRVHCETLFYKLK